MKRPGREADYEYPPTTVFKNAWSYTLHPPYFFFALCMIKRKDRLYSYRSSYLLFVAGPRKYENLDQDNRTLLQNRTREFFK